MRTEYGEWPELEDYYLEDSYLESIDEEDGTLCFTMELVLREGHPQYSPPPRNIQYCYRRGEIRFLGVRDVEWISKTGFKSVDAAGSVDMGNVDSLYRYDDVYFADGDWGELTFRASAISVLLFPITNGK